MTGRGELKIGNDWMTLLLLFGTQDLYEVYASSFDIAEYMMGRSMLLGIYILLV